MLGVVMQADRFPAGTSVCLRLASPSVRASDELTG
jgi:hypothetical protein